MATTLDSKVPSGPLEKKWDKHRGESKLVAPNNRPKFNIIVVGSGLAGLPRLQPWANSGITLNASASRTVLDEPTVSRRKVESTQRRTIKTTATAFIGFSMIRSKAATFAAANPTFIVWRISLNIIDQCVAQGVPFAREYGGLLANRSFGGAQVSRTFYARGQTGQQLLLGAYQALAPGRREER